MPEPPAPLMAAVEAALEFLWGKVARALARLTMWLRKRRLEEEHSWPVSIMVRETKANWDIQKNIDLEVAVELIPWVREPMDVVV